MRNANASGVLPTGSLCCASRLSRNSGTAIMRAISRWILSTTGRGVAAGASTPYHAIASKPGSPASVPPKREEHPEGEDYTCWTTQVEERQDDIDERAFRLAKNFNRGKEELDLAFRLQGEMRATAIRKGVDSLEKGESSVAQRLKTAKKFGVGRGEVDLAVRLREFKRKHIDKEEGV